MKSAGGCEDVRLKNVDKASNTDFNNVWSLRACLDKFISQLDSACWILSRSLTTDKIKL